MKIHPFPTALFAVVLAVFVACLPSPTSWTGSAEDQRVAVVGDSLIRHAEQGSPEVEGASYLTSLLIENNFQVATSFSIGSFTRELLDVGSQHNEPTANPTRLTWPEPGPNILVIALGSNDMNAGAEPTASALSNIAIHMSYYPEACVALVEVVESSIWQLDVFAPDYNLGLAELVASHPGGGTIIEWSESFYSHPEWFHADLVHHTDIGQEAYRSAILEGVLNCEAQIA